MHDRLVTIPQDLDLIVIGGGINGAGVARDAALRGLRVALFEKDDFACGASSKSSKLIHGGLRYLEHGAFRLVWEACKERRILLETAPHLVRPLPFVFPLYRNSRLPAWQVRFGMWLYDALAGFRNVRRHRMLHRQAAPWSDGLRRDGLLGLALYYDAKMDDARLVLANIVAARQAGASVLSRCRVRRWLQQEDRVCGVEVEDQQTGQEGRYFAPLVVSCTGPWTNGFLGALAGNPPLLAPTRGTHVIVRRRIDHGLTLAAGDGRIFFVLPWDDDLALIGTTDLDEARSPDEVTPMEEEVLYLLQEANRFFPSDPMAREDVVAAFTGLRPLLRANGSASARSREHSITEPRRGLICVAGGKYTTYRAVARDVVDLVMRRLRRRGRCRTAELPLPGGDLSWPAWKQWSEDPAWQESVSALASIHGADPAWARHLVRIHGSRAEQVLSLARTLPDGRERLCTHLPYRVAEVVFALREEMALRLGDWYFRRSRMGYSACHGAEAVETVAKIFAEELQWSARRRREEIAALRRQMEDASSSPPRASSH